MCLQSFILRWMRRRNHTIFPYKCQPLPPAGSGAWTDHKVPANSSLYAWCFVALYSRGLRKWWKWSRGHARHSRCFCQGFYQTKELARQVTYRKPFIPFLVPAIANCFCSVILVVTQVEGIPPVLLERLLHDEFEIRRDSSGSTLFYHFII